MNAGSFQALLGPVILPIFSCNEACCSALHTQVLSAVLHASTGAAGPVILPMFSCQKTCCLTPHTQVSLAILISLQGRCLSTVENVCIQATIRRSINAVASMWAVPISQMSACHQRLS